MPHVINRRKCDERHTREFEKRKEEKGGVSGKAQERKNKMRKSELASRSLAGGHGETDALPGAAGCRECRDDL